MGQWVSGAAPESMNTARTPQNPVDDDLFGRLWIAGFETCASCSQPMVSGAGHSPPLEKASAA